MTVSSAGPADTPAAAHVLAEAFRDDPVVGPLVVGRRRDPRLRALFAALLRSGARSGVQIDLARDTDGRILGVATWEPPGHRLTFRQQLPEVAGYARAVGFRGLLTGMRLELALARCRPRAPHWYLAELGVGDGARGRGIGSALLRSRLTTIDAARLPAYLESSSERNRTLYRRFGFSTVQRITRMPHADPAGMWRRPSEAG